MFFLKKSFGSIRETTIIKELELGWDETTMNVTESYTNKLPNTRVISGFRIGDEMGIMYHIFVSSMYISEIQL